MHHTFPGGDYLSIEVVRPGTAGVAFDCKMRLSFRCSTITASAEAWCDGSEVAGFVGEMDSLVSSLTGSASLAADDGRSLSVRIAPIDAVGHFAITASISSDRSFEGRIFGSGASASFPLSTQELSDLCSVLGAHIRASVGT